MTIEIKTIADPLAFTDWIETAPPGEKVTYHVGLLMRDRKEPTDEALNQLANSAWRNFESGRLTLTQQRIGENKYQYSAVKQQVKLRGRSGGQWK
jgi:septum formation inhibitor MinC